jgi:hypothetical protein
LVDRALLCPALFGWIAGALAPVLGTRESLE